MTSELSHLDADGRARMIDVGDKAVTARTATASGRFMTTVEVIGLVKAEGMPKADVLATARIAGIQGAKRTSELIPLCHPIPLNSVKIDFEFDETGITVTAVAKTTGKTGVEMEALTAVAIAGLTLHDMVKAVDPAATMTDIRLVEKTGGKRGHWTRDEPVVDDEEPRVIRDRTAAVIVASTAGAAGTREDTTGPVIADWLQREGFAVDRVSVVADADIAHALADVIATAPAVVITTGGTGVSPTDQTPEATAALLDRELPGIAEAIRARGIEKTPTASLSRGLAGVANGTVVINLPGSTGGVKDGLAALNGLLNHLAAQVAGGGLHE
jgi:cyclic pyranopterin monophosphate synthase